MRISDWSSDVCSSDLLAGADLHDIVEGHLLAPAMLHDREVPAIIIGIVGVARPDRHLPADPVADQRIHLDLVQPVAFVAEPGNDLFRKAPALAVLPLLHRTIFLLGKIVSLLLN